jgi:crotonobetainyl-CoA:carnitine CoA-transferase CaiB-like acyl-CoA transferase
LFAHTGRGKQSIVLNLVTSEGQEVLKALIEKSVSIFNVIKSSYASSVHIQFEIISRTSL